MSGQSPAIAIAIVCKTPEPGQSKTRLSPPLSVDESAGISACFIRDVSRTVELVVNEGTARGYAVYTPRGSEGLLRPLLPEGFALVPQSGGDLGARLVNASAHLLARHRGVILLNSDSPTLPAAVLREAVDALRRGADLALSPAQDGGYILIGLQNLHEEIFSAIPWSTPQVCAMTCDRARALGLQVTTLPGWYDVDDALSLEMLEAELSGQPPVFASMPGGDAPATRKFLRDRKGAPPA